MQELTEQQIQQIFNAEPANARREFEEERQQGSSGASGQGFMEFDGIEDDYDYYEPQPARQDRMKSRTKPPQFREETGDVLATLTGYLNRDIKKINILSSAISAQQYINDKHLDKRFSIYEQDLDDNEATPDNAVDYDKKKNTIYSDDGYTTAVGFGDKDHQHKKIWKKQYYTDVNDLEQTALAAKFKQQGIKDGPYMKWLSITKPYKIGNKVTLALAQAIQYYGNIIEQRQQQIGGYDLAKYKFIGSLVAVSDESF
ncbi:MAG: hypothetical protein EZS28_003499 [Streblomastix strix]|uniref:Uncharacterized protein n=1 Tax=Streblomastix strix TaxID=222440 RepID=A0A5J4X2R4_9EUKA|nr:MAG: hypothetical protein EZS28_003499 [Streblomastix strix]